MRAVPFCTSVNHINIEYRSVDALIPYARNPRTHSEAQVAKIAASIAEFGWTNPLLVDGVNGLIAGHSRLAAARKLGLTEVPVIELAHLSPTQKRAYVISDNRLALESGWDEELLALELTELCESGYDLALTGFEDAEIEAMMAEHIGDENGHEPASEDESSDAPDAGDDVPDVPVNPVSRPGDVWNLGEHRLICGDAGDEKVVSALMQGERAALCFTSPPYANQRTYTTGGIRDWDALMQQVFSTAMTVMDTSGQVLVNLGLVHREGSVVRYFDDWLSWMPRQGWRFFAWYVWNQVVTVPGDWAGRLAPIFEFIFHFNREARKPNKIVPCITAGRTSHSHGSNGMRSEDGNFLKWTHQDIPVQDSRIPDSIISATRQRGSIGKDIDHPAVFPVALPQFVLETYSDEGEIVFEPFGGSGTTMLAAQRSGRKCRSIEIAPEYVDVAIKRFQQNFPGVPVSLVATGQSFEAVASERLVPATQSIEANP